MKTLVACVGLLALGVQARGAEYARPELFAEPADVQEWSEHPHVPYFTSGVALVDVRSREAHATENLAPGRWIDIKEWSTAFASDRDQAEWSRRIAAVIGNPTTTVVVYDETVTPSAARAWWILKYWGVDDVRILNGGMRAWRAAGGKTFRETGRLSDPGQFIASPHPERLATRAELLEGLALENRSACVVDTRSDAEIARGVIPDARHADWVRFVDPATGKMRSADELSALLDEVGFEPDERAIAYCRSGGRASVVAFAMELMGGKRVANYFGSWNDWTSDPTAPIAELGGQAE